jgi:hypothetical protein
MLPRSWRGPYIGAYHPVGDPRRLARVSLAATGRKIYYLWLAMGAQHIMRMSADGSDREDLTLASRDLGYVTSRIDLAPTAYQ